MGGHDEGIETITLQHNSTARSRVVRTGDWVYKHQPKFLCDNEIWCYDQMWPSGYVTWAERLEDELIRIKFIKQMPILNPDHFIKHYQPILQSLEIAGIRHGDLTEYAVLVNERGMPQLIDFAESRRWNDPRPDKRREGDPYWLRVTLMKLAYGRSPE